jgi:O-methyltransferase
MSDAPDQQYRMLRRVLPKRLQPLLRGLRKRFQRSRRRLDEPYRTVFPYTQCSLERQQNLVRLCENVEREGVDGAIVECGVLDGGAAALMAWATRSSGRPVHLFDAWQGLPAPTVEDGSAAEAWAGEVVGSPRRVLAVMRKLGIERDRIVLHPGWFHDTFPGAAPAVGRIAVLHIDPDFYDPVRLCLDTWYPRVAAGGFIQFDDYAAFAGCRRAVDEFLKANPELSLEERGHTEGKAYFLRKP